MSAFEQRNAHFDRLFATKNLFWLGQSTVGALVLHDCTYRDFADDHVLAARFYPEGAITTYSFSKWLGLAGLRIGAVVANKAIIERLAAYSSATLGSSVIAQRAAQAGLAVKKEWMREVQRIQRRNQAAIKY